jgi:hypothetical protein
MGSPLQSIEQPNTKREKKGIRKKGVRKQHKKKKKEKAWSSPPLCK